MSYYFCQHFFCFYLHIFHLILLKNSFYFKKTGQDVYKRQAVWSAPASDSWESFYKKNRLSDDELQNFFSLPYTMGKENAPDKITDLSVVPKFTQKFTYFPYGVKLSKNTVFDDTYAIESNFSMPHKLSYYPLSLTSASSLFTSESGVPKKYQS